MQVASLRRVNAYWQSVFEAIGNETGDTLVVAHRCTELAEFPGVYCVLRHGQVLISAPPELVEPIHDLGATARTAIDPTWWKCQLPTWETHGPNVHAFTDQKPRLVDLAGVTIVPTRVEPLTTSVLRSQQRSGLNPGLPDVKSAKPGEQRRPMT